MRPSLEPGWKVRIEPIRGEIAAGDVLLIDNGGPRPILHRAVHVGEREGMPVVIQRGDAGGPLVATPLASVVGRAVAVLSPEAAPAPSLDALDSRSLRRFRRARWFARLQETSRNRLPAARRLFDHAAFLYGRKPLSVETTVSFSLDVSRAIAVSGDPGLAIREVGREEISSVLSRSRLPAQAPEEIDSLTASPWRCFVAFLGLEPVHHSFVEMRPGGPHLFRARTIASERGKGIFTAVVGSIAARLAGEDYRELTSSSNASNAASVAAHRSAGFIETRRRTEIRVLGVRPKRILARAFAKRRPRGPAGGPPTGDSGGSTPSGTRASIR